MGAERCQAKLCRRLSLHSALGSRQPFDLWEFQFGAFLVSGRFFFKAFSSSASCSASTNREGGEEGLGREGEERQELAKSVKRHVLLVIGLLGRFQAIGFCEEMPCCWWQH